KKIGICGQGPSDFPDFATFLVEQGIDSMSLIPDTAVKTRMAVRLYRQIVMELAKMQVHGRGDFNTSWCWDTPRYDRRLMLERESGYFLKALCVDFIGVNIDEKKIKQEFSALADRAGEADASFFLHRDFQSRNIMVRHDSVRFIDYQAGRLGPLGYDLASLLIDPYASLPQLSQDELLEYYLDVLTSLFPYDRHRFRREYVSLALQRNLQILGAFAFLSEQQGKLFFRQYITPALHSLQTLLAKVPASDYPYLKLITSHCLVEIKQRRPA
ncbi:MAG: hypothetical protein D3924_08285, partial [Candidatus Electrothrix sp. AR4]|nr:hypothetical protein [Candidatus Electrothrix sp. AR4]